MRKKKEEPAVPKLKIRGKMADAQYWKWRLTIEEMSHAKVVSENAHLKCRLRVLEVEKQQLQLILDRKLYQEKQDLVKQSQLEYTNIKGEIEEELGFSLDGCSINPHTYEVQELPKDEK